MCICIGEREATVRSSGTVKKPPTQRAKNAVTSPVLDVDKHSSEKINSAVDFTTCIICMILCMVLFD